MVFCFASNQGLVKSFLCQVLVPFYPSWRPVPICEKRESQRIEKRVQDECANVKPSSALFLSTFCHFSSLQAVSSVLRSKDNWVRVQSAPREALESCYIQDAVKARKKAYWVIKGNENIAHCCCHWCCRIASHQVQSLVFPLGLP